MPPITPTSAPFRPQPALSADQLNENPNGQVTQRLSSPINIPRARLAWRGQDTRYSPEDRLENRRCFVEHNNWIATQWMSAARQGNAAMLTHLFPVMDINHQNGEGQTALSIAATHGHLPVVNTLLNCSEIDVNLPDQNGQTPLMAAAACSRTDIVEALLNHPKTNVNKYDKNSNTALQIALARDDWDIVQVLLTRLWARNLSTSEGSGTT